MDYPGVNKPLTVENAIEIISRLHSPYSGFRYNIEKKKLDMIARIIKNSFWENNRDEFYIVTQSGLEVTVGVIHTFLGGQNWTENIDETERVTKEALKQLSKVGKAQQISKYESRKLSELELFDLLVNNKKLPEPISVEKWRIPPSCQRILGEGKGWVYLYYFDKEKAKAQDQRNEVCPCKIGLTQKDPEKRIQQQLEEDSDIPIIALLLRTDEPELLEKTIHGFLRLHGRHIEGDIQGREWFRTNLEEVALIYKFITDWKHQITL